MPKAKEENYWITLKVDEIENLTDLVGMTEAALKHVKRFVKKKNGAFKAKAFVAQHNPREVVKMTVQTGKRGRPKTVIQDFEQWGLGDGTVHPHVHMVINCNPGETVVEDLRKYWKKKFNFDRSVYVKTIDSKRGIANCLGYAREQASFERGAEYPKGYECGF